MEGITLSHLPVSHEDDRRALLEIFNSDFKAEHCKLLKIKKDSLLGSVWHDYKELIYIFEGEVVIELENTETKQRESINLKQGDKLTVSGRIAHRIQAKSGTIIIELWEQPYISDELNNHKYSFD